MHTLVPAVLLGVTWVDTVRPDTELDPPHGQLREAARGERCEGCAVVRTDGPWQSVFTKGRLEDGPRVAVVLAVHSRAAQQQARVGIGDGEGITARAVAGAKP